MQLTQACPCACTVQVQPVAELTPEQEQMLREYATGFPSADSCPEATEPDAWDADTAVETPRALTEETDKSKRRSGEYALELPLWSESERPK